MKGLRVSILKDAELGDCTNGGISATRKTLTLVGPNVPEIFEADEHAPAVHVIERKIGDRIYKHVEPVNPVPSDQIGYMAGGNFVYSSDSRFRQHCDYPLSLHDRVETPREYETLSV